MTGARVRTVVVGPDDPDPDDDEEARGWLDDDAPEEHGAALLDEVHAAVTRYVAWSSPEAADAFVLWLAATHAQAAWEHATRFVLKSPIKRCGKTRAQEVGRELAHRPLATTNISVAALVRSLDEHDPPTLFLDEADAIFGRAKDRPEGAEDLRGILNAGHSRGWPYVRWNMATRQREECSTFSMALVAGIGDLPDTIEDRAVVVSMRRRAPGEPVAQFRRRRAVPPLRALRARLNAWVRAHLDDLAGAEPDLPVSDRAADCWEPLVSVADAAGGHWPERARAACRALCEAGSSDEATAGERLLADLADVWGDAEYLATATILERLHAIEEAPWADWFGKPLDARVLAKLLRPYGITSRTVREPGAEQTARGYARADLHDAWTRYTHPSDTGDTSDTERHQRRSEGVSDAESPSDTHPTHPLSQVSEGDGAGCVGVSDVSDGQVDRATGDQEAMDV